VSDRALTDLSDDELLELANAKVKTSYADPGYLPEYSPTKGMTENQKVLSGAGARLADYGLGLKQLFGAPGELAAEKKALDAPLMETTEGKIGALGMDIASSYGPGGVLSLAGKAPMLGKMGAKVGALGEGLMMPRTMGQGASLGALQGAVSPAEDMGERGFNTAASSGVGAGVSFLPRLLSPQTNPGVLALKKEGVTPTPGQALGGGWNRAEEALGSIPILGDLVKNQRSRAVSELNEAAFNRALKPIGEKIPPDVAIGRNAVEYVGDKLSQKYNALLPQLTTTMDPQFLTDMQTIRAAAQTLPAAQRKQLNDIVKTQIGGKFRNGQSIDGETMKGIESELSRLSRNFQRDPSFDSRELGGRIEEVQDAFRSMVQRSNPQKARELSAINEGWANFKRVQKAAVAGTDDVFTAAQLDRAVKMSDPSKDKARYAEGKALMQDLSGPGKTVLQDKLPDSGTPYRSLAALAAGGAAGAHFLNPWTVAAAGAIPALYNPLGQKAALAALTMRPRVARQIGEGLPILTAPAVTVTNNARNNGR